MVHLVWTTVAEVTCLCRERPMHKRPTACIICYNWLVVSQNQVCDRCSVADDLTALHASQQKMPLLAICGLSAQELCASACKLMLQTTMHRMVPVAAGRWLLGGKEHRYVCRPFARSSIQFQDVLNNAVIS